MITSFDMQGVNVRLSWVKLGLANPTHLKLHAVPNLMISIPTRVGFAERKSRLDIREL